MNFISLPYLFWLSRITPQCIKHVYQQINLLQSGNWLHFGD
jgi:hypothetical protein